MASLNGVSVKRLKAIHGPMGIVWAGDLYLNNVKIGVWSNDYYEGPDSFKLLSGYDERKLKEEIQKRYPEWDMIPEEVFMGRLVDLTLEEQIFCNVAAGSGKLLLSISDGYHGVHIELPKEYAELSDEEIIKKDAEMIRVSSRKLLPQSRDIIHEIVIRRNVEGFCVGDSITLEAIREN